MAEEPVVMQPPVNPKFEALRQNFHYHVPFHIMICRPCQRAVFDAQVNRHLHLHHKSPDKAQFLPREVLSYFQEFPQRIQSAQNLVLPRKPIPAVPFLTEHCRTQHVWKPPHVSQRSTAIAPWAPIPSQQFISRGPGSQRFAVLVSPSDKGVSHDPPPRLSSPPANWLLQTGATPAEVASPSASARPPAPVSHPPRSSSPPSSHRGPAKTLAPPSRLSEACQLSPASPEVPALAQPPQAARNCTDTSRPTAQMPRTDDKAPPPPSSPPIYPRKRVRASKDSSVHSLSSSAPGNPSIECNQPAGRASSASTQAPTRPSKKPRRKALRIPTALESPRLHTYGSPDLIARFGSPEEVLTRALEDWARDCPLCRAEGLVPSMRTHALPSCEGVNAELGSYMLCPPGHGADDH
ncbi:Mitochondrial import inner membrane translocase subunit tim23 [Penicillium atrosanguineum]|uniref:Mitochondrial import inner membrane translocase subunit tim23 n=1 Tax=Penicillium atrosanguineum TaxID=1132637 RepID=UPI0023917ECE|nr:Mitochondrial import inner membrane translocase subunit tim23 [Penicillium atrosanguineum]KAJ5296213.1 Mitochondrial import inner membrane translocase subunit tim23 [Penicillium atrosanguineum]